MAWDADYLLTKEGSADLYRYDHTADMILALAYNKIDGIAMDDSALMVVLSQVSGVVVMEPPIGSSGYVMYMCPGREEAMASFNAFLADYKQTAEYEDLLMRQRAFDGVHFEDPAIPITGTGEELKVAISDDGYPRSFFDPATGEVLGYDMEPLIIWGNKTNYKLNIIQSNYDDMVLGLLSGRYDIAVGYLSELYREEATHAGLLVSDSFGDNPMHLCTKGDEPIRVHGDVDASFDELGDDSES